MSILAGVWIDHKKAILVLLGEASEEIHIIDSEVGSHTRASGGSTSGAANGSHDVVAEDKVQRRFTNHLNNYYRKVADSLCDADSLFILGPGEAKLEFKKQIKNKELLSRIASVETSDKLTAHRSPTRCKSSRLLRMIARKFTLIIARQDALPSRIPRRLQETDSHALHFSIVGNDL